MSAERRARLWERVVEHTGGEPVSLRHVCAVMTGCAGVDGVAVTVVVGMHRETAHASDATASALEELTLTLGEAPAIDAFAEGGAPVLVADLTAPRALTRWPVFAPAATDAGAHAVFALPLRIGAIRVGVLTLWRGKPGDLGGEQLADALTLTGTACLVLLDGHDRTSVSGRLEPIGQHPEVHQATGMVMIQLGVTAAVALVRLRGYAYAHDRRLYDVAVDVVTRRLRFDPRTDDGSQ